MYIMYNRQKSYSAIEHLIEKKLTNEVQVRQDKEKHTGNIRNIGSALVQFSYMKCLLATRPVTLCTYRTPNTACTACRILPDSSQSPCGKPEKGTAREEEGTSSTSRVTRGNLSQRAF